MPGPESDFSERIRLRAQALSRWNNEGGAGEGGLAHPASTTLSLEPLPLTNIELVQLQIRVIALENLLVVLLVEATDRQLELAREIAMDISPRPGFTPHRLTIHAAARMIGLVDRAGYLGALPDARLEFDTSVDDLGPSRTQKQEGSFVNTKLVGSIGAATRSRLAVVGEAALLLEVAGLLSETQISLVVVCDAGGAMVGVITKTNIVRQIGHCRGAACTSTAAAIMTRDVTFCSETDCLLDVLSMMQARGLVHVPVVDAQRKPSGVVNARDALRALWTEGQYEEALLRDYVMGVGYR